MKDWSKPLFLFPVYSHNLLSATNIPCIFKSQHWLHHHQIQHFFFSLLTSLQYFILKINPPFVKFSFLFALVVFHHLGYPPTFWSIFLWALFHLQLSKYTPKFFISSSLSKCSFFENLIISHLHTDELQLLIFKCFLDSFRYCSSSCPELNLLLLSFSSLSPIIYIPFLEE